MEELIKKLQEKAKVCGDKTKEDRARKGAYTDCIVELKALRIYAVMCCFIPFFGIIYHHFSRYDFFNPLFFLYHALTTSAIVAVVIKYFCL